MENKFQNPWDVGGEYYNQNALNTQFLPEGFLETKQSYQEWREGKKNDKRNNNITTQEKVLLFKKEKDAYKYLLDNTKKDLEKNGVPRPIENFAFITSSGVLVLPTKGLDIDGKEYRNYASTAEWRVVPYIIGNNGMHIEYGGRWYKVLATIHTHPGIRDGSIASHSGSDMGFAKNTKTLSLILSFDDRVYGLLPDSVRSVNFALNSDLTTGKISIINNFQQIIKVIASNDK